MERVNKRTRPEETHSLLLLRPLWFRITLRKRRIFLFGARLSLLIVTLTGTHVESKRLFIQDLIPTTSIEIVEWKLLKLGYPRSNDTTADQCGPLTSMRVDHFASCENIVPQFQNPSILPPLPDWSLNPLQETLRQPVLESFIIAFIVVRGWKIN